MRKGGQVQERGCGVIVCARVCHHVCVSRLGFARGQRWWGTGRRELRREPNTGRRVEYRLTVRVDLRLDGRERSVDSPNVASVPLIPNTDARSIIRITNRK